MTATTVSAHPYTHETTPVRLAVIIGSVRKDRFGPVPARWIARQLGTRPNVEVDLIDLAEFDLPQVLNGDDESEPAPEPVKAMSQRLTQADGFVVVTPVYNRSHPASLKLLIDWFYEEWTAKSVGFVAYGGMTGGMQSAEHLRAIFSEFNTASPSDPLLFQNFWETFDEDGPRESEALDGATKLFVDQLLWWTRTLRRARAESPFPV